MRVARPRGNPLPFLFRRSPEQGPEQASPARIIALPAPAPKSAVPSLRQCLGFYAMVAGLFLAIVDIQLVTSSMKEIQAGLSAGLDEIGWVQSAYLIGEIVMIALAGPLTRAFGTRLLFTLSALGFALMSLLCGMASSLGEMAAARALQGFLGGAMVPTVFAANILIFPPARQVRMTVLIGLVATLAPTLGPVIGGMVTQALSWRWLFFITVVPGLAVAWAVWVLVDIDRGDKAVLRKFDGFGALLLAVSLGSLQYVLHEGPRLQWLDDGTVMALLLVVAVAGALLLWRCLRRPAAILDLGVFRDRNFTIGCLFNVALGAGLFVGDYLMTQYLGRVRGLNSQQIGETLLVTGAFEVLGAPVSLWLATRVDPRIVLGLGYALFGFGLYLATGMTADWDFDELFWSQAVRGFSLMLCFVPVTGLALGTLPARQAPDASGLFNLTRNVGGAVGLAWVATALQDRTALHYDRLAESLDAYDPLVQDRLAAMAAGLSDVIGHAPDLAALRIMSGVVRRQAEVMAFNDLLLMLAGIVGLAVLLLPFVRRNGTVPAISGH
jgi:DHA2 family multidrug resistance protein